MKTLFEKNSKAELSELCTSVKALVANEDYENCFEPICTAMERYPHSPEPHNLIGIILEKTGRHNIAMKHFRAALALDPDYTPATHNLYNFGTFFSGGFCAFDESDVS